MRGCRFASRGGRFPPAQFGFWFSLRFRRSRNRGAADRYGFLAVLLFERTGCRLGPDHALVLRGNRRQAPIIKFLDALAAKRFSGEDISFGIGGDAVHGVKFTRLASAISETREYFHRFAIQDVNFVVRTIGHVNKSLL